MSKGKNILLWLIGAALLLWFLLRKATSTSTVKVNLRSGGKNLGEYQVSTADWASLQARKGGFQNMPPIAGVACAMELWLANYYAEGKTDIEHSPGATAYLLQHGVAGWGKSAGDNFNLAAAYFSKYGRPYAFDFPDPVATVAVPAPTPMAGALDGAAGDGGVPFVLYGADNKEVARKLIPADPTMKRIAVFQAGAAEWAILGPKFGVPQAMEQWFEYWSREGKGDYDHSPGTSAYIRTYVPTWGPAGVNANVAAATWAKYGRPYRNHVAPPVTLTAPAPEL